MKAACFVDTNVLLYRASTDEAERPKRLVAEALLRRDDIGLSAQVLAEFYHNAINKPGVRMAPETAAAVAEALALLPVVPVTAEIVQAAIRLQQRYQILLGRHHPRRRHGTRRHHRLLRGPRPRPDLRRRDRPQPLPPRRRTA